MLKLVRSLIVGSAMALSLVPTLAHAAAPRDDAGSWSVTLSSGPSSDPSLSDWVGLTAQANQDVGSSPYQIDIVEIDHGSLYTCGSGATCSVDTLPDGGTYMAQIDDPNDPSTIVAQSAPITLGSGTPSGSGTPAPPGGGTDTPTICDSVTADMVNGIDLSGTWTNDGEVVTLTQVGSSVTGIASYTEGGSATYTGCFDGTTYYLNYNNAVDSGYGQLTLSANGNTLTGSWYSTVDGSGSQDWSLTRTSN